MRGATGGDGGDLFVAAFNFFGVVEDGKGEGKAPGLAGFELGNAAKMPLYPAIVGEAGAGFDSGNIS